MNRPAIRIATTNATNGQARTKCIDMAVVLKGSTSASTSACCME